MNRGVLITMRLSIKVLQAEIVIIRTLPNPCRYNTYHFPLHFTNWSSHPLNLNFLANDITLNQMNRKHPSEFWIKYMDLLHYCFFHWLLKIDAFVSLIVSSYGMTSPFRINGTREYVINVIIKIIGIFWRTV